MQLTNRQDIKNSLGTVGTQAREAISMLRAYIENLDYLAGCESSEDDRDTIKAARRELAVMGLRLSQQTLGQLRDLASEMLMGAGKDEVRAVCAPNVWKERDGTVIRTVASEFVLPPEFSETAVEAVLDHAVKAAAKVGAALLAVVTLATLRR